LLLMDSELPHPKNSTVCEILRRSNGAVPVILFAAWPGQDQQASRCGIDAVIEKPLDLRLLLELMGELLTEPESVRADRRYKQALLEVSRAA
jgi:CheY-like chemotaxis protein